ncbi:LOW QUALITY PROTEIN: hypothetical protein V2J09_021614, partial [Rumex salicifolius]
DHLSKAVVAHGHATDGLYKFVAHLDIRNLTSSACFNVHCKDSAHLFHRHLGHISFSKLLHVSCFKDSTMSNTFCDTCSQAKFHRLLFPTSITRSVVVFDLLHIDLWGPFSTSLNAGPHGLICCTPKIRCLTLSRVSLHWLALSLARGLRSSGLIGDSLIIEPSYDNLRVIGCLCYVVVLKRGRDKMDPRGIKCVLLGYLSNRRGTKFLISTINMLFTAGMLSFMRINFLIKYFHLHRLSSQLRIQPTAFASRDICDDGDPLLVLPLALHQSGNPASPSPTHDEASPSMVTDSPSPLVTQNSIPPGLELRISVRTRQEPSWCSDCVMTTNRAQDHLAFLT